MRLFDHGSEVRTSICSSSILRFYGQLQQLIAVLIDSNLCLLAANLDHGSGHIVNQLHGMFCLSQEI